MMDQEELYQNYQSQLGRLEEEWEDYQRKRRHWEENLEAERAEIIHERMVVERRLNHWSECSDAGILRADFEEALEQYDQEIRSEEQAFQEEQHRLQSELSSCEEWYQEEKRKQEEEGWQE